MSEPIKSIEEFIAQTKQLEGRLLLYRGLANADWEVESSAHRRIKESQGASPPPIVFQSYIYRLLDNAGLQGFREHQDRRLSDLELLAELQHYGAATCLIDFTTNALIALWFACEEKSDKSGKVVAMATDDPENFSHIGYDDLNHKAIKEFLNMGKLWKWSPGGLNNRIVAQQSVFVFGEGNIGKSYYEEIEIDAGSKQSIKEVLEKLYGLKEQQLFNDFAGFALCNAHDKPYDEFTAEEFVSLGVTFHQQGDMDKAIDYYDKAIELNPQDVIAYTIRGSAKNELGNPQGAILDYNKAIELHPQNAIAYTNRGDVKQTLGDPQGAILDYDKAIEFNPKRGEAYTNRGIAKSLLGDHLGAISDYDKAVGLDPQDTQSYTNRGVTKSLLGDHLGAISDYDKVIELNPQLAEAYTTRGIAKGISGDHYGAILDCDKAIKLKPQFAKAYSNRGVVKGISGDHYGAILDCNKAIELNPQLAEAYTTRGIAKSVGNHKDAIEDYNKAIKLDSQDVEAYYNRGISKIKMEDIEGAIQDFDKAIETNPQDAKSYYNRGLAKSALGDDGGAAEDFATAQRLDPNGYENGSNS